jgi:hypothetical protein
METALRLHWPIADGRHVLSRPKPRGAIAVERITLALRGELFCNQNFTTENLADVEHADTVSGQDTSHELPQLAASASALCDQLRKLATKINTTL